MNKASVTGILFYNSTRSDSRPLLSDPLIKRDTTHFNSASQIRKPAETAVVRPDNLLCVRKSCRTIICIIIRLEKHRESPDLHDSLTNCRQNWYHHTTQLRHQSRIFNQIFMLGTFSRAVGTKRKMWPELFMTSLQPTPGHGNNRRKMSSCFNMRRWSSSGRGKLRNGFQTAQHEGTDR